MDLHHTVMGKEFFTRWFPELVRAIQKQNELIEQNNGLVQDMIESQRANQPETPPLVWLEDEEAPCEDVPPISDEDEPPVRKVVINIIDGEAEITEAPDDVEVIIYNLDK